MFRRSILACAALIACANVALAGDVVGVWLHEDGGSKVRFAPCGAALCGFISWLKKPDEMVPSGDNAWVGKAFEPSSGKEYSGKMSLSGDRLTTAGCVLGGLICKSISWTRAP